MQGLPDIEFRTAVPGDGGEISRLVCALSEKFIAPDLTPSGNRILLESMTPDSIQKNIQNGFQYHVAVSENQIVGVIGILDNSHLYQLFVADSHHQQGIASTLWEIARQTCLSRGNHGEFTVNSSRYALPVYERLGFVAQSGFKEKNGVIYIPMKWEINR
jgi:GNAT superfamily N-acetyltransferase